MKYIDVSEWQGAVDWAQVKPHVNGVILRAGFGKGHADKRFAEYATECNRLGIPIGAYWFSYAATAEEAEAEAKCLLDAVKPYKMELPLAFDFEYDSVKNAEKRGVKVTMQLASAMVRAFCDAIEAGGYWALFYANPDYLSRYFDANLPQRYGLWLAQWPGTVDVTNPPRQCAIWQWGGSEVPGITDNVDTNEAYTDFKSIITGAGLNHLGFADGDSVVHEYTQAKPAEKNPALAWAQSFKITDDAAIAEALWRYHNVFHAPEDAKSVGGITTDD